MYGSLMRGSLIGISLRVAAGFATAFSVTAATAQDFGDTPYVQTPLVGVDAML